MANFSRKTQYIQLRGLRTHNLKNLNIDIPLGCVIAVTGVSGSGKTSLVFDTLYAESYRRYLESLSSFSRQHLTKMTKPSYDSINFLPPSIALKQNNLNNNPRTTVATITEIDDLLRLLFLEFSVPYCPNCNKLIESYQPESIAKSLQTNLSLGDKLLVLAPLEPYQKLGKSDISHFFLSQGLTRVFSLLTKETTEITPDFSDFSEHAIIIDRLALNTNHHGRLLEALSLAFRIGKGQVIIYAQERILRYSENPFCFTCKKSFPQKNLAIFSTDHPLGACPTCSGFGMEMLLDIEKSIPNHLLSLKTEGISPWNFGSCRDWYLLAFASAKKMGIATEKQFNQYTPSDWEWLIHGDHSDYPGIEGFFVWLKSQYYKPHYRMHRHKFHRFVECSLCHGAKLNSEALNFRLNRKNISELHKLPIYELLFWTNELKSTETVTQTSLQESFALTELIEKIEILCELGIDYLDLSRRCNTLSGGEFQRLSLARCLGTSLTETLYCLDEPSTGLHPIDMEKLSSILQKLKNQGNTVICVEHEQNILKRADQVIEIGPTGGDQGGYLTFQGDATQYMPPPPDKVIFPPIADFKYIQLKNIQIHNLKNISVSIPLHAFTVICGVSGSGKSSLIMQGCYPLLKAALAKAAPDMPVIGQIFLEKDPHSHYTVELIDQKPLTRSSRSMVVTYLGLYDALRELYLSQALAKELKLTKGSFSTNVSGGRCETCLGLGYIIEDMSFLGQMDAPCPTCMGKRFNDDILKVHYQNKNIYDFFNLTLNQAQEFFPDDPKIALIFSRARKLGLGYLTLGQSTTALSGGELQRLKLMSILGKESTKPSILIMDEPTKGLSETDVALLLGLFRELLENGCTIICIEHHLTMISHAHWIIELGPGAAAKGGEIVYQGPGAELKLCASSKTARFLSF